MGMPWNGENVMQCFFCAPSLARGSPFGLVQRGSACAGPKLAGRGRHLLGFPLFAPFPAGSCNDSMQSDLKALEFDGIRRLLEKLASTPYGADAARGLEPAPALDQARQFQAAVTAARLAIDAGQTPPLRELPDVRAALRQASHVGAALNPTALHNLRSVMRTAAALVPYVEQRPALCPGGASALVPPTPVLERIDQTLADSGRLREDASAPLAALHQEQRRHIDDAAAMVRQRMRQPDLAGVFENPDKVHWHSQRAVVSLHRDVAERVKGVRRGSAMGGRDILIEPIEAVGANNHIEAVAGRISAEEHKLLREVTGLVREHQEMIQGLLSTLTWLDLAFAAGHLSAHLNATPPQLVDELRIELNDAYHPLLLLQFAEATGARPIPLSVHLDGDERIMVVTGPNTGGKTVVLKTLGLLCTMAHCGLHLPAEGDCTIGDYRRVMVDVGDHQSLYHHLSTFAGHVEVLKRILATADRHTLVLLDELGTGTDPEEGAALAMSVMDELVEREVQGIVNTHLSPLKEYAAGKDHIVNASMQFDQELLKPTYRLRIGVPGESLGLIVAEKNGLPHDLVERARAYLLRLAGGQV